MDETIISDSQISVIMTNPSASLKQGTVRALRVEMYSCKSLENHTKIYQGALLLSSEIAY